ncbi:MAG: serine/threonine-protein kinase [Myxococcota bacterium]
MGDSTNQRTTTTTRPTAATSPAAGRATDSDPHADGALEVWMPGSRLGQYELVQPLGGGAMADIWEVHHLGLGKAFALKALKQELLGHDKMRRRFLEEGRSAARIHHHHVVNVTDVGELAGRPFMVMELLGGEDLGALLDRLHRLPLQDAIHIIVPIIAGTWAGHQAGIVHRDVKPENIHLAREGRGRIRPVLVDFGISVAQLEGAERVTQADAVLGTPIYMSPEQARGAEVGPASDQYALAVVLYEMITGNVPRESESILAALNAAATGEVTPPSHHVEIDPALEEVLLKALARTPGERFPDLPSFALALLPWADARVRDFWSRELLSPEEVSPSASGEHLLSDRPSLRLAGLLEGGPSSRPSRRNAMGQGPHTTAGASGERSPAPSTVAAPSPSASSESMRPRAITIASPTKAPSRGATWVLVALLVVVGLVALVAFVMRDGSGASEEETAMGAPGATGDATSVAVELSVLPATATIELDGREVGRGSYAGTLRDDDTRHTVVFRADGHRTHSLSFRGATVPTATVRLEPEPPRDPPPVTEAAVPGRAVPTPALPMPAGPMPAGPMPAGPRPPRTATPPPPSEAKPAEEPVAPEPEPAPPAAPAPAPSAPPPATWEKANKKDNKNPWD